MDVTGWTESVYLDANALDARVRRAGDRGV